MVVGEPADEQRELFEHTVAAQQVAFAAFESATTTADVDKAVLAYMEDNGIRDLWRQHTGHGIGLRNHESPFLDVGDDTPLEPGMVLTIEPGVYKEGLGGFRHSDTVLVTPGGIDILTDYPRDLDSLIISD
jgi:Xaa-Pro aminopeptidase